VKKVKTEIANDGFTEEELKLYTEQNNILSKFRDELKNLSKKKLIKLLEANNQAVTGGIVVVVELFFSFFEVIFQGHFPGFGPIG
jgi:hypothetical protein